MPNLSIGIRRLIDAQLRFTQPAFPVYIRLRDFADVQLTDWAALGFSITPTGGPTGTQDILINPPAAYLMVSLHNIGQSEGKLRFGARQFLISDTFVRSIASMFGYSDPTLVFRNSNVVGLITENKLFDIVTYWHEEASGQTVDWGVLANSSELPVTGP